MDVRPPVHSAPGASPEKRRSTRKRLSRTKSFNGQDRGDKGFGSLVGDSDEGDALAKALTQSQIKYESAPAPTPIGSAEKNEDVAGQSRGVPRAAAVPEKDVMSPTSGQVSVGQQESQPLLRSNRSAVATVESAGARGAEGLQRNDAEVMRALADGFGIMNSKFDFLKEWLFSQAYWKLRTRTPGAD